MEHTIGCDLYAKETTGATGTIAVVIRTKNGDYIASLTYTTKESKDDLQKGFWVDFLQRGELTQEQVEAVQQFLSIEIKEYLSKMLDSNLPKHF